MNERSIWIDVVKRLHIGKRPAIYVEPCAEILDLAEAEGVSLTEEAGQ